MASPAAGATGSYPGVPVDLHRLRTVFPDRFAALLRQHFRGPSHVSVFFNVDERTARDWWHGRFAPSGVFVAVAIATLPGAVAYLMGEAA